MNLAETQRLAANVSAAKETLRLVANQLGLESFNWAQLETATVCIQEAYSLADGAGQPQLLDDVAQLKAQVERALEGLRFLEGFGGP